MDLLLNLNEGLFKVVYKKKKKRRFSRIWTMEYKSGMNICTICPKNQILSMSQAFFKESVICFYWIYSKYISIALQKCFFSNWLTIKTKMVLAVELVGTLQKSRCERRCCWLFEHKMISCRCHIKNKDDAKPLVHLLTSCKSHVVNVDGAGC